MNYLDGAKTDEASKVSRVGKCNDNHDAPLML